ncbi:uncharacterized protein PV07_09831 [Cladophialophora immunda]|uniref:Uncharacterized protein n=1 Tax=Cladophialophora immunda TaxID=569365 RepID=A0A0D2AGW4_9EURO|nr:uncharacterized protein PV07_09831 [Cladophialophora immunda]KIW24097.1 hypothetical protein PV07_09831 [Cladophialophora immunda]OQU99414.1 hypothetical protein CLAIMM_05050 [Cladophialophora immunda]
MPANNSSKKLVGHTKTKRVETRPSGKKDYEDDGNRSLSDCSSMVSAYRYETRKAPKEPQRYEDEGRPPSFPPDSRSPRHILDSSRAAERQAPAQNPSTGTYLPIYEAIIVLRRHGISVNLGPDGLRAIAQQGPLEPRPVSHNHKYSPQNVSTDVHHPSAQEQQAITEAIVFIVWECGGQVDIPGFDPQPAMQCSTCSNPIPNSMPSPVSPRRDVDEHSNGNRNSYQNIHRSHAETFEPNNQGGHITIGLESAYDTRRNESNWGGHGR